LEKEERKDVEEEEEEEIKKGEYKERKICA
jgi:hypothetical protein